MAGLLLVTALGGFLSLFIAPFIGKKWGKKGGIIGSTVLFAVFFSMPFNLRLLGVFPENGDPNLLPFYLLTLLIAYLFLWVALSLANSMMADVVDEYELLNKEREEGLFFASMSFAYKATVGLGYLAAGFLLKMIAFPEVDRYAKVAPEIPQSAIDGLGWIGGPIIMCFYLIGILFIMYYPITKERHAEIRQGLDK